MFSHCIGVSRVKKNGASPVDRMKISTFIHLQKKIVFDPRFALEGNDFSSGVYLLWGDKTIHRINVGKFCEDIEDRDWKFECTWELFGELGNREKQRAGI